MARVSWVWGLQTLHSLHFLCLLPSQKGMAARLCFLKCYSLAPPPPAPMGIKEAAEKDGRVECEEIQLFIQASQWKSSPSGFGSHKFSPYHRRSDTREGQHNGRSPPWHCAGPRVKTAIVCNYFQWNSPYFPHGLSVWLLDRLRVTKKKKKKELAVGLFQERHIKLSIKLEQV